MGDAVSVDRGVREEAELRERALFYVASTRARKELLVTCRGKASRLLTQ
jgi:superfamily I DNA/RNA helicase